MISINSRHVRLLFLILVFGVQPALSQTTDSPPPANVATIILTPLPSPRAAIHGPKVFGVRPGSPFLYAIPATGDAPLTFSADNLPAGLKLDSAMGQITGTLATKGEFNVTLHAKNAAGESARPFKIIVGDQICLTPPMGWNSWNCWGDKVSQDKVLAAANAFVAKGLKAHGWTYINIDDGWQGVRGGPFNAIQPNEKFPDMPGLSQQVHAMGLKLGIYSTPWRGAYSGHIGSSCDNADGTYDWIKSGDYALYYVYPKTRNPEHPKQNYVMGKFPFLTQDAQQWTAWGIDYLKYDWNPVKTPEIDAMRAALQAQPRDFVYSLSNGLYFNWAADYPSRANAWRISGDIIDTWASLKKIGFSRGAWSKAPLGNDKWEPYVGPGHYIDPDMLIVGQVGWGKPHPTRLTPDEQYAHISQWCLLSAPLMLGCDMDKLDDFTLSLLTNDEVLDIDQDSLCKLAILKGGTENQPVYAKPLDDGSWAVGLFNLADTPATATVNWTDLALTGSKIVRDLWRQKDLGSFPTQFSATVNPHGVVLVRVSPATTSSN